MKNTGLFFLLIFGFFSAAYSQKNTDSSSLNLHSEIAFANYLIDQENFELAKLQLWKLKQKDSEESKLFELLFRYYRRIGSFDSAMFYIANIKEFDFEKAKQLENYIYFLQGKLPPKNNLKTDELFFYYCIAGKIDSAKMISRNFGKNTNSKFINDVEDLLYLVEEYQFKKRGKALLFSMLLPGAGQMYAGRGKDGRLAMVSTLVNTAMAIVTIRKFGWKKSVWPYLFSGLAVGFYGGSLYGSYHAVQYEQVIQKNRIRKKAYELAQKYFER